MKHTTSTKVITTGSSFSLKPGTIKILLFLLGIYMLVFNTSCNPVTYMTNAVNVPLLHEKNEIKASFANDNAQVSFALTDHIGLMVNTFWFNTAIKDDGGILTKRYYGHLTEVGAGYYTSNYRPFIMEVYGGYGLGGLLNNEYNVRSYSSKGDRFFLLGNMGLSYKYFDVAFSQRLSIVQYNDFRTNGYSAAQIELYKLDKAVHEEGMFLFFEPALTVRGGYKFLKIQVQGGMVVKATQRPLSYVEDFFNIGIVLDIAQWHK